MIVLVIVVAAVVTVLAIVGAIATAVMVGEYLEQRRRRPLPPATARALRRSQHALRLQLPKERIVKRVTKKKLKLIPETVRQLTNAQLGGARGGSCETGSLTTDAEASGRRCDRTWPDPL